MNGRGHATPEVQELYNADGDFLCEENDQLEERLRPLVSAALGKEAEGGWLVSWATALEQRLDEAIERHNAQHPSRRVKPRVPADWMYRPRH